MKNLIFIVLILLFPSFAFGQGYSTCQEAWAGSVHVEVNPTSGLYYKAWSYTYNAARVIEVTDGGVYTGKGCYEPDQMLTLPGTSWESRYIQPDMDICVLPNKHYHVRRNSLSFPTYSTVESCPSIPDSDGDGVFDVFDQCSDTPPDVPVDAVGCPLEPASCSDSILSGDETGIDCGGTCFASCDLLCPDGWPPVDPDSWFPEGMCFGGLFPSNALGDCPVNTIKNESGGCIGIESPIYISSNYSTAEIVALGIEPIDYSYTGDTNVFTQDTTTSVIDNGDGTSTETTVNTVASGSDTSATSETTTRTDVIDNSTSQIISSSIVTVTNEAADDSLSTWGLDGGFPVAEYDADISSDIPDKKNITDSGSFLDDFILTSPFFSVLQTASITTEDTVCSIDTDLNFSGHAMSIPFDLCQWESHLIQFGVLLLLVSQFYALLIVYRGWKL